ncbi:MAG: 3-methyl-2-oxobutanoate dehydrogenase subunit VorB [Ignavibacterium sp.]|jgi:2-oxoglutarate ferredoxin oxidoreductase subunit alpha|nr:MAG: 3-methyl-2-oxobutanoate dehydrogenase subunit VorB [Ignavibacterium sp.]MBW7843465.1 3-methyl-2-oxobutanoate dehydrogenase subunit VorB [Ignavibacterium sp.]MDD5608709.1 3-methyl-2-oxobutanoate dehydrogenase subunit VorB [Ignavibacterium sp.]MDX9712550.1 3-methyl-2-oxobutanoate dehydrogenase subunit VorB [Ignavibacteriaceae bacterium]HMN17895.1 3-methyl-2-oxobutanoate dehydrogenase subunit VorB [Ignavibacteriaceae bacterium]
MEKEIRKEEPRLMKGNEALAEAAIRANIDAYFGYPITPQSEVIEYLMLEVPKRKDKETVVLQAESEVASINMVYGAAGAGARVMTSSSSPGISLMQEGISYIASAQLPCLIVNVVRGGPGLGTIQPSQSDYFQATKGGGHGDYHLIVLAPSSVQELADFVFDAFKLAEKYRNPAMILADGALGQMMEKVVLPADNSFPKVAKPWATTGKTKDRERNIITSLFIQPEVMEKVNLELQEKYAAMQSEVRWEEFNTDDAEVLLVAFGLSARICQKVMDLGRAKGIKIGLLRPITLYPFPYKRIAELSEKVEFILDVEMNAGQMVEDVRLAVEGKTPVYFKGRMGGMISTPEDILNEVEAISEKLNVLHE